MDDSERRQSSRLRSSVLWSLTWSFGVAVGVALGGWLTLTSGAGAPGAQDLDPLSDLVVLPAVAFGCMFVVQLAVRLVAASFRDRGEQQHEQ